MWGSRRKTIVLRTSQGPTSSYLPPHFPALCNMAPCPSMELPAPQRSFSGSMLAVLLADVQFQSWQVNVQKRDLQVRVSTVVIVCTDMFWTSRRAYSRQAHSKAWSTATSNNQAGHKASALCPSPPRAPPTVALRGLSVGESLSLPRYVMFPTEMEKVCI